MQTTVIIDGIVAAVLLGFLLWGGRRGLFRSVAGLVVLVAALVGACVAADHLTPVLAERLQPVIERRVAARVDAAMDDAAPVEPQLPDASAPDTGDGSGGDGELEIGALLALLGLDRDPAADIAENARRQVRDAGVDLANAVVQSVAESVLHTAVFLLAFLALALGLKLLARLVDLALKLPGLHGLNALGGAAVGLAEGALVLFLAVWVLRRFGVSFDGGLLDQTTLARFFTANTPLSALPF